jgi:DedD protein
MRTLFDSDEEEIEGKASEITLSTASLLGIFFGLVLICGVFFGFGYSTGRGTGSVARANTVMNPPASNGIDGDETAAAVPQAAVPQAASLPVEPKADRQVSEKTESAPAAVPAPPTAPTVKVKEETATEEAPAKPALPVSNKPAPGRQSIAYLPPTDTPPTTAGQPMVQIAAVARPEDAAVLVSALRQRGYGVVVRNEPQDKLLHVQVGPFADRTQASVMKQKLLSDGYNAIIKQ